jgi:hypothetical protein
LSQTTKPTRQQIRREKLNIGSDVDLNTLITPIQPSTNTATKKDILANVTKKQLELIKFHLKSRHSERGLTIQHLDPRQNRYNSVRYQFLKEAGHFLKEGLKCWNCHQDGCDYFTTQTKIYFISFNEDNEKSIQLDNVKADDIVMVGHDAASKHLFKGHPDFTSKRLGEMGVSLK